MGSVIEKWRGHSEAATVGGAPDAVKPPASRIYPAPSVLFMLQCETEVSDQRPSI